MRLSPLRNKELMEGKKGSCAYRVMGCWCVELERSRRKKEHWGLFFRVGFLALKKNMSASGGTNTQPVTRTRVWVEWKKSTGCVDSRARLMGVLGIGRMFSGLYIKLGPKLIRVEWVARTCVGENLLIKKALKERKKKALTFLSRSTFRPRRHENAEVFRS